MKSKFKTDGVCSKSIEIELDELDIIKNVYFEGGCNGNLKGISALVVGHNAYDIKDKLDGIYCGTRETSCPDQLAKAINIALENKNKVSP